MSEQKPMPRGRTFLAGKVISNYGQSTIDCTVRRISDTGAEIEVESVLGVPEHFHLLIPGEGDPQPCKRSWQSEKRIGLVFETAEAATTEAAPASESRGADQIVRTQMLALRAALDVMDVGVVLLDANMKSQFINRAFRRMWALPDATADRNPAFVALLYHGRDTRAYEIEPDAIDRHIANRVRMVREGDTTPIDVRLTNGNVVRVQSTALPNGGRIVTYSYVTDIVRHMDELEVLRSALDNVSEGVVLLDGNLNAQFLNRKVRQFWGVTEEQVASHPSYASLLDNSPLATARDMSPAELKAFNARRVETVRKGDTTLVDLRTSDGRDLRAQCTVTKNGGRMLTYCDISDLVRNARQMEELATIDSMTGLYNRRHFMTLAATEWSRFQRYYRPLSVLMIDVDHFKSVNDRYGHAVGDAALVSVANACRQDKRSSDIVGRIGGEEFAMLLPETDLYQARIVADRICKAVAAGTLKTHGVEFKVTASIGFAAATVSMSGFEALLNAADQALYQAKDNGRNRIVAWSPPPAARLAAE